MFELTQRVYDALYAFKDYAAESEAVDGIIRERVPEARTLLDVACGTGGHLRHLRARYQCEGLDLNEGLLAVAREHLSGVPLHQGDMTGFDLGRDFDAVTCLFSSIGLVETLEGMRAAIASMARHVRRGGVLLVEPWLPVEAWIPGHVGLTVADEPDLKVARLNDSRLEGRVWRMTFHYLIGERGEIGYVTEEARITSFTHEEFADAFEAAGCDATFTEPGPTGRGLWIALRRG